MSFEPILYGPLFVQDAQDVNLVASSTDPVNVTVSVGGSSWTIPVTPVLTGGRYLAPLRMREILASVVDIPGLAAAGVREVPVVTLSAGGTTMSFRAVYGSAAGHTPTQLAGHWLTWRDQISTTQTWARERLTFLAGLDLLGWQSGTYVVQAKVFFASGDPETVTLASGTIQSGCRYVTVDASFSAISAAVQGAGTITAWDVNYNFSGQNASGAVSVNGYPLRLILARQDVRVKEFIFSNSFGVEDRVISSGRSNPKLEGSSVPFLNGGTERELRNDAEEGKEVYSGHISSARGSALWSDFLKSKDRHILLSGNLEQIIVDSQETDMQENALGSVKFTYHLAKLDAGRYFDDASGLGNYDPGEQYGALYVGSDPPGEEIPSEDLFFLKTRLDEFPAADLTEELLFLVQNPLTLSWGNLSLNGLKDWLQEEISAYETPVWSGPWEDYSAGVADYALAASLGRDLYDRILLIEQNPYNLPIASDTVLGGIKVGSGLSIDGSGVLSVDAPDLETLTLKVGTSQVGTYTPTDAQTLTITKQHIVGAIGQEVYHPYGGDTENNTFKIGGATLTWHAASGSTPGYIELDSAFVSHGDQVLGDGTPGGGGGTVSSYLRELLDVQYNLSPSVNDILIYASGVPLNPSGSTVGYGWKNISKSDFFSDYYSKSEVDALIGAIDQFHYEIAASTSAVSNPQPNVLYLIGPTGSGSDKYEEYVYANSTWTKIGDTSLDLSGYVQSASVKKLSLTVGSTSLGTFDPLGANDTSWTISSQNIYDAIGSTKYHKYGGDTALMTFKIGGATLTWHAASGSTPGYIEIDSALITTGDQILGSGTPSGGGTTGATNLWQLDDVDVPSSAAQLIEGQALVWDATAGKWKNRSITQGTVTRVDVGTTQYSPTDGVVSLPAYPTTLPASDVYAWAKAVSKPSYSLSEITGTDDLRAIEALTGTSGLLKKTGANTWELDTTSPTYISHGETAYNDLTTVSSMLQSLQCQVDSVASRDMFDELTASSFFSDVAAIQDLRAGYAHAERLYLADGVYLYAETVDNIVCVRLNAPLITTGDQILGSGTPSGGGGGDISYLYELTDVDDSLSAPVSGTLLQWYSNKWVGTAFTGISNGDLLTYSGGKWTNVARSSVGITTDATQSAHGLMSAADKTKLDSINTTYIANGETAYEALNVIGPALQSLQAQIDSVASRDCFDELSAAAVFADVIAASDIYATLHGSLEGNADTATDADKLDGQHGSYYAAASAVSTLQGYFTNGVANNADKLDGQHGSYYATASSVTTLQGYFTNGVANDADKLDGIHASGLFTAMSSSAATNLSITIGGTNKTTTLYATYDSASENISDKFGIVDGALRSLQSQIDSVASRSDFSDFEATTEAKLDYVCDIMRSLQAQVDSVASRTGDFFSSHVHFDTVSVGTAIYGDVLITTGDQTLSDERRKKITRDIILTAEQIASCRAVAFDWTDQPGSSFGSIAQDWQKILPEAVSDRNDTLYLYYGQSAEVAVINLAREVVKLKEEIKQLRQQNNGGC